MYWRHCDGTRYRAVQVCRGCPLLGSSRVLPCRFAAAVYCDLTRLCFVVLGLLFHPVIRHSEQYRSNQRRKRSECRLLCFHWKSGACSEPRQLGRSKAALKPALILPSRPARIVSDHLQREHNRFLAITSTAVLPCLFPLTRCLWKLFFIEHFTAKRPEDRRGGRSAEWVRKPVQQTADTRVPEHEPSPPVRVRTLCRPVRPPASICCVLCPACTSNRTTDSALEAYPLFLTCRRPITIITAITIHITEIMQAKGYRCNKVPPRWPAKCTGNIRL